MARITDKERLDWLIYKGNLWAEGDFCVAETNNPTGIRGTGPNNRPRQAIDAAIRAELRAKRAGRKGR